ncbi:MAG: acyl-CoA dehydrogenase [Halioglobus sp.]|nr:acyl-CoA dehydrogenase [Halioglobus sp.]
MSSYRAPLEDMQFVIDELCDIETSLGSLPGFAETGAGPELTTALLDESARLCGEVLAPLRRVGDEHPASCADGAVTLSPGYADAFRQLAAGGWLGISAPVEYGGQGLPEIYTTAACEMWNSADMAIALAPILSIGAALTLNVHGSEDQKLTYLEKMYSGAWTGTMNLTEAGAGSDLGVLKTRAVPEGDHYRLYGQKIFITWGDHDAAENIVHLVLAKTPGAPEGSRGISLFIVPKFLVNQDGSIGARNDVYPVSTEHKMGIHGSPTCVMAFGDKEGAIGYLVGRENEGMRYMFTMMNEARLKIGLQGLSVGEGAYQKAVTWARERVQGGVPIIQHADVKRMLLTMRALNEAMRAFAYTEAVTMDRAHQLKSVAQQARIDLMTPVIKGWMTEVGVELASLGIQVHGGMGYIEETGAAQFLRDVRIAAIYEGTNGIQAQDLVARKLCRDGGAAMEALLAEADATVAQCGGQLGDIGRALQQSLADLRKTTSRLLADYAENQAAVMGKAFDYLMQVGYVMGAWHMARSAVVSAAQVARGKDNPFYGQKLGTARFYMENILPRTRACVALILDGGPALTDYPEGWL